jgi:DNA replication protein DnaC
MKDGMLYCSTCNEPKLYKSAKYGMIRCVCSCYTKQVNKELKRAEDQKRLEKFKVLQKQSLIGERFADATFDNTIIDEKTDPSFKIAFDRCKKFCENHKEVLDNGYGIYIYSEQSGNGKTWLATCIVNELTKQLVPCLFTNFFEILMELNNTFNGSEKENQIIDKLAKIPLLVIDDIGTERLLVNGEDNRMQEKVYTIINRRYNEKKSTIFTSNLTMRELVTKRGMMIKTVDRISEMSSATLNIKGESFRSKTKPKELPF